MSICVPDGVRHRGNGQPTGVFLHGPGAIRITLRGIDTGRPADDNLDIGLPRVLEYSLLSIFGCSFCSQWMNCRNLWKFGASRFHSSTCQPGNTSEYIHLEGCLFKALTLRAPGTLTHHPFFVIGSLYESTSGISPSDNLDIAAREGTEDRGSHRETCSIWTSQYVLRRRQRQLG